MSSSNSPVNDYEIVENTLEENPEFLLSDDELGDMPESPMNMDSATDLVLTQLKPILETSLREGYSNMYNDILDEWMEGHVDYDRSHELEENCQKLQENLSIANDQIIELEGNSQKLQENLSIANDRITELESAHALRTSELTLDYDEKINNLFLEIASGNKLLNQEIDGNERLTKYSKELEENNNKLKSALNTSQNELEERVGSVQNISLQLDEYVTDLFEANKFIGIQTNKIIDYDSKLEDQNDILSKMELELLELRNYKQTHPDTTDIDILANVCSNKLKSNLKRCQESRIDEESVKTMSDPGYKKRYNLRPRTGQNKLN